MKKNVFKLSGKQLKEIAQSLQRKIEDGLSEDNTEIQCIPTFITPKTTAVKGKAVVLDLGGTNYRAAVVEFSAKKTAIHPENGWKKDLSVMKTPGFTQKALLKEQADLISELKKDKPMPIGYCFSYPAESLPGGDANLIRWTKGVDIREMVGEPVGQPLLDYLNTRHKGQFTGIKVLNDTVASLFAGLTDSTYDAYIGLIVGTGTNMATFIPSDKIGKLDPGLKQSGLIPVNLESGNFNPPHLTAFDESVDAASDSTGRQRFEKAVSGMYLGEILKSVFPNDEFESKFDALKLTNMMSYPDIYNEKYVRVARWIYKRSARLVAASLAGLILVLVSQDETIRKIRLIAEGSLFWSKDLQGKDYRELVLTELRKLLDGFGHADIEVHVEEMHNANLIGSAIAALS